MNKYICTIYTGLNTCIMSIPIHLTRHDNPSTNEAIFYIVDVIYAMLQ